MSGHVRVVTEAEWNEEGERLFGPDRFKWRFQCPVCGNVATPDDFRPYKSKGAHPNSATCECIGRYQAGVRAFAQDGVEAGNGQSRPCDYAGYGLFRLSPVHIVRAELVSHCFAFAEAPK